MRKILLFAGLIAMVASLAACGKLNDNPTAAGAAGIPVTLDVIDAEWTPDTDSRTAYTPGTGIRMTGTEEIKLYYKSDKLYNSNVKASPTGNTDEYSFTMPAEADGATSWYGFTPYSQNLLGITSNGGMATVRLGPVQFPGANSFDPMCDYMALKPFAVEGTAGAKSGSIEGFKRIFAPLCLSVSGLPVGAKIYTATLSMSQEPTNTEALTALYYVNLGDTFDGTSIGSTEQTSRGNAVSVEYASGLAAVDGVWPIWLMTGPITMNTGTSLTLSVSTEDRTYTRTVTLPSDQTLSTTTLNRIRFNITGSGYTSRESVTQDFTSQTLGGTKTLTASDGSSLTWVTPASCTYSSSNDGDSGIKSALKLTSNSLTFPDIAGKNIVGARIFTHPCSRSNAGAEVKLTVDGTDDYIYNLAQSTLANSMAYKGGAIDIALPAGQASLSGLTMSATAQNHLISAITLFTEDKAIDPNDYYELFLAGNDITINGTVYNNSSYTARSVPIDDLTIADYIKNVGTNGILFIDDSGNPGGTKDFGSDRIRSGDIVVIGRFKNSQPGFSTSTVITPCGHTALKNLRIESSYAYGMFNPSLDTDDDGSTVHSYNRDFVIEDCTLVYTAGNALIRDGNANYCFRNVSLSNSVVFCQSGLVYNATGAGATAHTGQELLKIDNCVLTAPSGVQKWQILFNGLNSGTALANMDVVFTHNTLYNLGQRCLISIYKPKSVNVSYNVYHVNYTEESALFAIQGADDGSYSGSHCDYNYCYSAYSSAAQNCLHGYSAISKAGISVVDNINNMSAFNSDPSPFTSVDTATGYFPVNEAVVTNGAGASYSTKLWKTWE